MMRPSNSKRIHAALSLLLQYPDATTVKTMPQVREMARHLDSDAQQAFNAFADWLQNSPLLDAQAHYVDLFDRKRRACLYLSYYLNGDTRRRGMALVRFKELYREYGFEATGEELPDFLPTLLQFCAMADERVGDEVLAGHRAGIAVLHKALLDARSPYSSLVEVLLAVVPETANDEEHMLRLIEVGPPTELVGLDPFVAPETVGVGAR